MNPVTRRLTSVILLAAGWAVLMPATANAQRRFGKSPPRYKPMRTAQQTQPAQFESEVFDIPTADGNDIIPEVLDEVLPEYASPDYDAGIDAIPQGEVPTVDVPSPAYESDPQPLDTSSEEIFSPLEPIADDTIGSVVDDGYMMDYNANFSDEPAPVYSTGSWFKRGDWYTEISAVVYDRSKTRERVTTIVPLANGQNQTLSITQTILTDGGFAYRFSSLVRHNYESGARIMLGKFLGRDAARRDHGIDFTFTGGFDWESERTINSATGGSLSTQLTFNANDPLAFPFLNADEQTIRYDADLTSMEANYKIVTRPGRDQLAMQPDGRWVRHGIGSRLITFLGGFRYMGFNESVDYTSLRLINPGVTDGAVGRHLTRTNNDMIGFQLGFDSTEKYDDFHWGIRGKVGGLFNFVDRRSLISNATIDIDDVRTPSGAQRKDTDEVFSFLADIGIHGAYQLRPNLHLRAGYDFVLLTNQSLAPDNLEFISGFSTLNTGGTVFMHGGTLGVEATW
ncbi:MAG: BBP7 family outer membrane beta-barrel protein [Planctomycetota bacterium]